MEPSIEDMLAELAELRGQLRKIDDGIKRLQDHHADLYGEDHDPGPASEKQQDPR